MQTLQNVQNTIQENLAVLLYFSGPDCGVCHVLKPKIFEAIETNFEAFKLVEIDISVSQDIAAHYGVFTAPTLIVYLDGKEFLKKSRNMSVDEVVREIARPYEIMTS